MAELGRLVKKIRSKNAGPFWLTIDIFCDTAEIYERVVDGIKTDAVAGILNVAPSDLKRFDIADLNVVKFSLPRPHIQGTRADRDMHGASFSILLSKLDV